MAARPVMFRVLSVLAAMVAMGVVMTWRLMVTAVFVWIVAQASAGMALRGRSLQTLTISIDVVPSQSIPRRSSSFWLPTFARSDSTFASAAGDRRGGIDDTIRLSK
jgi:hypothetical protein